MRPTRRWGGGDTQSGIPYVEKIISEYTDSENNLLIELDFGKFNDIELTYNSLGSLNYVEFDVVGVQNPILGNIYTVCGSINIKEDMYSKFPFSSSSHICITNEPNTANRFLFEIGFQYSTSMLNNTPFFDIAYAILSGTNDAQTA